MVIWQIGVVLYMHKAWLASHKCVSACILMGCGHTVYGTHHIRNNSELVWNAQHVTVNTMPCTKPNWISASLSYIIQITGLMYLVHVQLGPMSGGWGSLWNPTPSCCVSIAINVLQFYPLYHLNRKHKHNIDKYILYPVYQSLSLNYNYVIKSHF